MSSESASAIDSLATSERRRRPGSARTAKRDSALRREAIRRQLEDDRLRVSLEEAATFGDRSLAARVAGTRMPSDRMFNRLLARQDRELQARHRTERDAFLRAQMASRERHEARLGEVTSATAEDVALARATLGRAVTDGRLLPIRALKINELLDAATAEVPAHQWSQHREVGR